MQTLIQQEKPEKRKKYSLVTMEYVISIISFHYVLMRIFLIDPRAILFGKSFNDDDETAKDNGMVDADKKQSKAIYENYS